MSSSIKVGVIMGSSSDWEVMQHAALSLQKLGIAYEARVVSAHRTPELMFDYAKQAAGRGLHCIIAGAGGAAHLPGMLAAITQLPVLGVPVPSRHLKGMDSLLSIVQMPRGVPVATVAIGNATNGALLAVRILGAHMPALCDLMEVYQSRMESEVMGKVDTLARVGWKAYAASMKK